MPEAGSDDRRFRAAPGVPVIINGIDASYAVVEGDWGLGKGVHVQPTIYGGRPVDPMPNVGHYFPSSGHLPGYGRLEIETAADEAETRARVSINPGPPHSAADPPAPLNQVPPNPPPVIVAPPYPQNSIQQNFGNPPPGDPRGPQRHP